MLHYIKIGTGSKVMIGFHGFGRDASMFQNYENVFPDYTIYSIALYFHGSSWTRPTYDLNEDEWKSEFSEFLDTHRIDKFSILGFSLGGKLALFTYQIFSERVENIHLLAPYGIQKNFIESLVQKTPFLFWKMKKFIDQPAFLFRLAKGLHNSKLLNPTLMQIILRQLDSKEKRSTAFYSMLLYGAIELNLKEIRQSFERQKANVHIYLGKFDQVLRLENLYQHLGSLSNFSLHVLPSGHSSLPHKVRDILRQKTVMSDVDISKNNQPQLQMY